jgi:hypothetical protein
MRRNYSYEKEHWRGRLLLKTSIPRPLRTLTLTHSGGTRKQERLLARKAACKFSFLPYSLRGNKHAYLLSCFLSIRLSSYSPFPQTRKGVYVHARYRSSQPKGR